MKTNAQSSVSSIAAVGLALFTGLLADRASGAVIPVDLLGLNSSAPGPNGSIFNQLSINSGTGNWDPFLTVQNGPTERGFNTDNPTTGVDNPDIVIGGTRTHSVSFGQMRYTTVAGIDYIQFLLDLGEGGSARYIGMNDFRIFAPSPGSFASYNGTLAGLGTPLYDMDSAGDRTLLMDADHGSGNGVSDLQLLVPLSLFGGLTSSRSIVVYTRFGDGAGVSEAGFPGFVNSDWVSSGSFEEWSISKTDTLVSTPEASTVVMVAGLCAGIGLVEFRRRQKRFVPVRV